MKKRKKETSTSEGVWNSILGASYHYFKQPQAVVPSYMNIDSLLSYYLGTVEEKKEKYCQTLWV